MAAKMDGTTAETTVFCWVVRTGDSTAVNSVDHSAGQTAVKKGDSTAVLTASRLAESSASQKAATRVWTKAGQTV